MKDTSLFTPHCARSCPVPFEKVANKRKTGIKYDSGNADVLQDEWKHPSTAHSDLGNSGMGNMVPST